MKKIWKLWFLVLVVLGCDDPYDGTTYQIYNVNPISTYLESQPECSEWVKVLKYADLYNAINQATSMFTAFVPENEAVTAFYAKKGVSSIQDLGYEYARTLVKYHVINDTVNLETFIAGGKLESQTLSEDYLSVSFRTSEGEDGGFNSTYINREAGVTEFATAVSNGYIYKINAVLSPLVESVYTRVKENGTYSIFVKAMEKTAWGDSLNILADTVRNANGSQTITKRSYTLLAVPDAVFHAAGISSADALISHLGAGSDYTNPSNALFKYVAYHILKGTYYLADLQKFSSDADTSRLWGPMAQNEVLQISKVNGTYYLNYSEGTGTRFVDEQCDIEAKNGIVQQLDGYLPVWGPEQSTVLFDFCDYAEVASYIKEHGTSGQIYQTVNATTEYRTALASITTKEMNVGCYAISISSSGPGAALSSWGYLDYFTAKASNGSAWGQPGGGGAHNWDMLTVNVGYNGSVAMETPTLIKGKYKVTLRFGFATSMDFMRLTSSGSNGGQMRLTFDDDNEQYVTPYTEVPSKTLGMYNVVAYDEVEFETTTSHIFKFVVTDPAASTNSSFRLLLDYLLFEPIKD